MGQQMTDKRYAVCIDNSDYRASLELRKLYEVLADERADELKQLRIIDESGEDYLYPASRFLPIDLSDEVMNAVAKAA